MSHKIKMTIHDELYQVITDYADDHDCTVSFAAAQVCAIGAESIEGRPVKGIASRWGGKRKGAGRKTADDS